MIETTSQVEEREALRPPSSPTTPLPSAEQAPPFYPLHDDSDDVMVMPSNNTFFPGGSSVASSQQTLILRNNNNVDDVRDDRFTNIHQRSCTLAVPGRHPQTLDMASVYEKGGVYNAHSLDKSGAYTARVYDKSGAHNTGVYDDRSAAYGAGQYETYDHRSLDNYNRRQDVTQQPGQGELHYPRKTEEVMRGRGNVPGGSLGRQRRHQPSPQPVPPPALPSYNNQLYLEPLEHTV